MTLFKNLQVMKLAGFLHIKGSRLKIKQYLFDFY